MNNQITVIEHCRNITAAKKQVATSFKAIAPHSKIHIRKRPNGCSVYVLNRSCLNEQLTLLRFAVEVARGILGKTPENL